MLYYVVGVDWNLVAFYPF
uniref:Uncharacterized protein n=1 Tax=Arundo donax TaxID=35708 RepID=A0A0A8Y804_ARUDO